MSCVRWGLKGLLENKYDLYLIKKHNFLTSRFGSRRYSPAQRAVEIHAFSVILKSQNTRIKTCFWCLKWSYKTGNRLWIISSVVRYILLATELHPVQVRIHYLYLFKSSFPFQPTLYIYSIYWPPCWYSPTYSYEYFWLIAYLWPSSVWKKQGLLSLNVRFTVDCPTAAKEGWKRALPYARH